MKISSHMIVKETTEFGRRLVQAALESLLRSEYSDELVFVDNGCIESVRATYLDIFKKFEAAGVRVSLQTIEEDVPFNVLRNLALDATSKDTDWIAWQDSDEVRVPEKWKFLKAQLSRAPADSGRAVTMLKHLMITPDQIQDTLPKDNVLKYYPDVRWSSESLVHEHYPALDKGIHYMDLPYVHFGYCRAQWRTCLKWLRYSLLEDGDLRAYKMENLEEEIDGEKRIVQKPWFRDWRHPNAILDDRKTACTTYEEAKPAEAEEFFANAHRWSDYLAELDPDDFWKEWQEQAKALGGWEHTLDWLLERMTEYQWNLV